MDAKLNKNSSQMLKALNDVLIQKQKAGNDLLRQAQAVLAKFLRNLMQIHYPFFYPHNKNIHTASSKFITD